MIEKKCSLFQEKFHLDCFFCRSKKCGHFFERFEKMGTKFRKKKISVSNLFYPEKVLAEERILNNNTASIDLRFPGHDRLSSWNNNIVYLTDGLQFERHGSGNNLESVYKKEETRLAVWIGLGEMLINSGFNGFRNRIYSRSGCLRFSWIGCAESSWSSGRDIVRNRRHRVHVRRYKFFIFKKFLDELLTEFLSWKIQNFAVFVIIADSYEILVFSQVSATLNLVREFRKPDPHIFTVMSQSVNS